MFCIQQFLIGLGIEDEFFFGLDEDFIVDVGEIVLFVIVFNFLLNVKVDKDRKSRFKFFGKKKSVESSVLVLVYLQYSIREMRDISYKKEKKSKEGCSFVFVFIVLDF